MRLKFDFVHKVYYSFDRDIPEFLIQEYCDHNNLTMKEFKVNIDEHAYDLAYYISTHYEQLGDDLTEEKQDGLIFYAELK